MGNERLRGSGSSTNLANPIWSPVATNTLRTVRPISAIPSGRITPDVSTAFVRLELEKRIFMEAKATFLETAHSKLLAGRLRTACVAGVRFLLLVLALPAVVEARDYTYYTNNGTITITGYIGSGGAVSIPSMLDDMPVTGIESSAFNSSFRLTSVAIPGSVTRIGNWAFNNCTNLTSVTIGNGLTNIGERAFSYCRNLTNVAIPDSVTLIQGEVFLWCSSLPNITIPKSVMMIMPQAFYHCTNLTAINVEILNPNFTSLDGVLFDKSMTSLIRCPEGKGGSYTVPDGVTRIGNWAFQNNINLGSVTMPNSVTNIGERAFSDCTSLTNVTIPDSVNTVGAYGFSSCTSLPSATIPTSVTNIARDVLWMHQPD